MYTFITLTTKESEAAKCWVFCPRVFSYGVLPLEMFCPGFFCPRGVLSWGVLYYTPDSYLVFLYKFLLVLPCHVIQASETSQVTVALPIFTVVSDTQRETFTLHIYIAWCRYLYYYSSLAANICPKKFDEFLAGCPQFDSDHRCRIAGTLLEICQRSSR